MTFRSPTKLSPGSAPGQMFVPAALENYGQQSMFMSQQQQQSQVGSKVNLLLCMFSGVIGVANLVVILRIFITSSSLKSNN